MNTSRAPIAASVFGTFLCATVSAQVTQRLSVDSSGAQGNNNSFDPSLSADGRYVAFFSEASNLVPGDTNSTRDVFVRDRQSGVTERVSVDSSGVEGNGESRYSSISADGRFVAFESNSSNLVPGDTSGGKDVFVRDRFLGLTERVSVSSAGAQANGASEFPSISADGRHVSFHSSGSNLVPGDTNGKRDVFVRDRLLGTTERVSVDSAGIQGDMDSGRLARSASINADGRFVAFWSWATNLVPGDTNGQLDVFVRDRLLGTTERASVSSNGVEGQGGSAAPSMSADGRFVTFSSFAGNLVPGDTNDRYDIFVHDRQTGATERVSVDSSGAQGNGPSFTSAVSSDGRYVVFDSGSTNLVGGDGNGVSDVFIRDRLLGSTERMSVDSAGVQGNNSSEVGSVSANGLYVAFHSFATNLATGDTNSTFDIVLRDRFGGPVFTSLCDPSVGGVLACPCSNPPNGAGRGCDNSSATGGAVLSASGGTYLSSDSLVFRTSGERPTAFSIVLQGDLPASNGVIHGQGVWCAAGSFKILYRRTASGGSISAPDFGAGEPTVSAMSSAKGDAIQPGQSRWYLVYYRDPSVLGGCPASSTFNATQTGQVTWLP
jgi:Tol biopolymer transport system component